MCKLKKLEETRNRATGLFRITRSWRIASKHLLCNYLLQKGPDFGINTSFLIAHVAYNPLYFRLQLSWELYLGFEAFESYARNPRRVRSSGKFSDIVWKRPASIVRNLGSYSSVPFPVYKTNKRLKTIISITFPRYTGWMIALLCLLKSEPEANSEMGYCALE